MNKKTELRRDNTPVSGFTAQVRPPNAGCIGGGKFMNGTVCPYPVFRFRITVSAVVMEDRSGCDAAGMVGQRNGNPRQRNASACLHLDGLTRNVAAVRDLFFPR